MRGALVQARSLGRPVGVGPVQGSNPRQPRVSL